MRTLNDKKLIEKQTRSEYNRHLLIISHKEAPKKISRTTTCLVDEARAFKGEYAGCGTQVVKK